MKQKKIRGYTILTVLAAFLTVLFGARGVRAEEAEVTEINGSVQLIRELSQSWEDDYTADDTAGSYQTKQIIVFADNITDYCGAVNVLHYEDIGTYYLQYETEEDTRNAYRQLKKRYGKNCMLDEIVKAEDWQMSGGVSWGSDYTGLDQLKFTPSVSGLGGTVTVAVVDTGLNTQHILFSGRKISSASRNLVDNSANISDVSGHGTHVAGIVADCTPKQVELMAVRVFDDQGLSSEAMLQAGILYAIQKGADVINLSLGDTNHVNNDNWLAPCIEAAWEKGIPLVCAAGNSKKDVSTCYPACDEKTIAVSAIDRTGSFAKNFSSAEGSNFGTGIDFAAPGVSINSASIRNNYELESRSGTSMSAPFVAAAAAYVKLALPQSTVNQVKSILRSYAVDYGAPGKDDYYGYGVIRMDKLQIGLSGNVKLTVQNPSMVFSGKPCCPGILVSGISSGQYSVSYANNTHPGTATVTVTGKGVFTGTVSTNFRITLGTPAISAVNCTAKGIQIQWKSLAGADRYIIFRKKNNGSFSRIKTASGSATSYTDTGVSSGNTYQYRIYATGSGVTSDYSAIKKTVFVKAASLTGVTNGDNGVTLKWKKVSGISGYYVYRKAASQTSWQLLRRISSGSTMSCTDTKAVQGQQYTYQVRPYKKVSGQKYKGGAANTKTIVCMKKMTAPTLKNVKTKSIQVFWKRAVGADGYQIRWSLKKSMTSAKTMKITNPQQLKATISGLKKNKTYYVQIRSLKKTGKSTVYGNWSKKKTVRIRK